MFSCPLPLKAKPATNEESSDKQKKRIFKRVQCNIAGFEDPNVLKGLKKFGRKLSNKSTGELLEVYYSTFGASVFTQSIDSEAERINWFENKNLSSVKFVLKKVMAFTLKSRTIER